MKRPPVHLSQSPERCAEVRLHVSIAFDGERTLPNADRQHLERCTECTVFELSLARLSASFDGLRRAAPERPELWERLRARLPEPQPRRCEFVGAGLASSAWVYAAAALLGFASVLAPGLVAERDHERDLQLGTQAMSARVSASRPAESSSRVVRSPPEMRVLAATPELRFLQHIHSTIGEVR